jgi:phasin family protein
VVKPVAKAAKAPAMKPVAPITPPIKPAAAVPAPKPVVAAPAKAEPVKAAPKAKPAPKPTPKIVAKSTKVVPVPVKTTAAPKAAKPKETPKMTAETTTKEFTAKIQSAVKDATSKAKTFAEKAQANAGEFGEFAKGNVEAVVESTKILAAGFQGMGKSYVAETKTAFETMTADVKDLAAAKTPTEFFEKQSAILRKNFDAAVANSSKTSEAVLKLAGEAFQPLSTRVSLAMEKVKKAA